ncbi:hypothetical protein GYB22_07840 [bacterium]|nr:hypothetical protein [bacterium]
MLKYIFFIFIGPQLCLGQQHLLPSAKSNALGQTSLFNSGINTIFNGVEPFDSAQSRIGVNLSNLFGLKEYSDLGISVRLGNKTNSVGASYFIRPYQFSTEQIIAFGMSQLIGSGLRISIAASHLQNTEEGILRINQLRAALGARVRINDEFQAIVRYSQLAKLSSPNAGSVNIGLQYSPHSSFTVSSEWRSNFQYHFNWSTGFEFILKNVRLYTGVSAPGFNMSFGFALGLDHLTVFSAAVHPVLGISPQFSYEY